MQPHLLAHKGKRVAWSLVSIAIAATLSGCSQLAAPFKQISPSQQNSAEEAPKALSPITAKISPRLVWQQQLTSNQHAGHLEIYPQVVGERIIAAGKNTISAFNRETGKLLWSETLEQNITAGLSSANNMVFVGTEKGSAIALDITTGKTRWISLLTQPIAAISAVKNKTVVFRTLTGKIHALSSADGELMWQQTQQTPALSLQGASTPILAGPFVISGFDNGSISAYEATTGKEAWSVKLGVESSQTELSSLTDIDAEMITIGTALFAVSYQGFIAGIDMKKGNIGWKQSISSFSGIDANDKELFVSDNEGHIWKLNSLTGDPLWKNDDLLRRAPTTPVITGAYVVVGDNEGYLHWYNRQSGEIVGRIHSNSKGYSVAPKAIGNKVYTLGKNGLLSAYTMGK